MKQLISITTLFILFQGSYGQSLNEKWDNTYTSDATVNDIISDSNGNVYTLFTEDNGTDFDIKLIKHNKTGVQQWVKTYGSSVGDENDHGIKLQIDESDNVYFLGIINPGATNNGVVVKKYNSSGTQQYEYVSTATVGNQPYDFVVSSANEVFISAKRFTHFTVKYDAILLRLSSSGTLAATATYNAGGAGTDQLAYKVGITGSNVKVAVVDGTSYLRVLTYPTNFSTGTDNQTGNRRYTASGTLGEVDEMVIEDENEIYVVCKNDGVYFLRRFDTVSPIANEFGTNITDMDQINSMYVDASSNIYLTGYETVTGSPTRNQLALEKYNSAGVQQFEINLKPDGVSNDHGSVHTEGVFVDENASGDIVVIGDLALATVSSGGNVNNMVGAVVFESTGGQLEIEGYGGSPLGTIDIQAGTMDGNGVLYFAGLQTNTIYFYSMCDPPVIDLGGDVNEDYDPSGNSLLLDAGNGFESYEWSTGATTQTIIVTEEGDYSVTITNAGGCTANDEMTYTFNPIDQTITWSQTIPTQTYGGANALIATASSGLDVTFSSSDDGTAEPVFDGSDWELQIKGVGTVTITASQEGDDNYNAAATVDKMITIDLADFYWVGNGGDYSDFSNHWATSSGGNTFHTLQPDQYCNIYFDENSFNSESQTITGGNGMKCNDFIVSGVLNNPTFDIQELEVYGSIDFSTDAIYSIHALEFVSDASETVNFNGSVIDLGNQTDRWTFNGNGSWEFIGDVTFKANKININNSADIIIGVGATFSTTGPMILNPSTSLTNNGSLIFESGANFINESGSSFSGNDFTFKRNTTFDASIGNYSIVGSPITDASTSALGSLVYAYDESQDAASNDGADRFIEVTTPETMSAGAGYFSAFTGEITVTGTPNSGTINVPLDFTSSTGSEGDWDGFNLVSNPYPAGLTVESFLLGNGPSGSNAIEPVIYIWVDGGSDFGQRSSADYMTVNSIGTIGGNVDRSSNYIGYLGSFQGFFVQAKGVGKTLSFTEDMRLASGLGSWDSDFFRKGEQKIFKIKIGLSSPSSYSETLIGYLDDASTGVDAMYDARRFNGNANIDLASLIEDDRYAIQGRPLTSDIDITSLMYRTEMAGIHTLSIDLENRPDAANLILLDLYTSEVTALKNETTYNFYSEKGTFSDRLEVIASTSLITSLDTDLEDHIIVHQAGGHLEIQSGSTPLKAVIVYDLNGKQIANIIIEGLSTQVSLPLKYAQRQIVIVKAFTENGQSHVKKIVLN